MPDDRTTAKRKTGRFRRFVVGLALVACGVIAGAYWSDEIRGAIACMRGASAIRPDENANGSKQLWTCGMHPQVIQDHPGDCPICHMKLTPLKMDDGGAAAGGLDNSGTGKGMSTDSPTTAERKIKYWWDPMLSPPYISDKPGKSPMGMDLIPVYEDEVSAGAGVTIDPAVVQNMGVRVAAVEVRPFGRSIRAVGYLDEAEPAIHDINLRVSGWIQRLQSDIEGMHLERGDPLFDLYSPELQVAIGELITARRVSTAVRKQYDIPGSSDQTVFQDAERKLELLGLSRAQIDTLAKLDRAPETVTFTSPITGHLTEKMVVAGAAVKAGDRVLRIVDHSTLWIDAQIYEQDLPFIKLGQKVTAKIASRPGNAIEGEVIFIHPHVDMMTRTAKVRMAIPNPSLTLRPGMYATLYVQVERAERAVMAPREAVIDSGTRQITFVASGGGHFEPRNVTMGLAGDDGMVQIIEGLAPGESVVVSGQFLLDSESRLREAIRKFLHEKQQMAMKHAAPMTESGPAGTVEHKAEHAERGMGAAQGGETAARPQATRQVDGLLSAYLEITDKLGAIQQTDTPVDVSKLVSAAHGFHGAALGGSYQPLAVSIAEASEALRDKPINAQRESFNELSGKVVELVDKLPPSRAVTRKLYRMHCPMAPGDWLQTNEHVANPFYAKEMKECGELVKIIDTQKDGDR